MNIKLIVTDMDGTLLNDNKQIPEINIKALLKAQEQGILVVIASGRIPQTMNFFIDQLQIKKYSKLVIGSNGGLIFDYQTNNYVYEEACSYEDTVLAVKIMEKNNYNFYLAPMDEKKAYVSNEKYLNSNIFGLKDTGIKCLKIDYNNIPQMRKLVIDEKDLKIQEKINNLFANSETLKTEITGTGYIEIMPKIVSKWHAVEKLIDYLAKNRNVIINPSEIICFGDQMNDYLMLKNSFNSVAVASAVKEAKEVAKYVSNDNNNDGAVGKFIYQNILKQ